MSRAVVLIALDHPPSMSLHVARKSDQILAPRPSRLYEAESMVGLFRHFLSLAIAGFRTAMEGYFVASPEKFSKPNDDIQGLVPALHCPL